MTTIRTLTVGGLVGVALTLGLAGVASATPTSSTAGTSTTATSTTTPSGSHSTTSAPPRVLTGPEIWRIVRPRHGISCAHAAKQVQRVKQAESAAAKRMTRHQAKASRQQAKASHQQSSGSRHATKRTTHTTAKVSGFQKLHSEGQALIKRIEAKCPSAAPAV
ncbi:MAG TPA: hypothetical protein VNC61_12965 [Acidimicrobiales bacterium]|nr:hypothetical protein [Acidimicrobiales bacterium]